MTDNTQKLPVQRSVEEFTNKKAKLIGALDGQMLPASVVSVGQGGGVVTVKFELANTKYTLPNITVPVVGSKWVRLPIQAGTMGWLMSASAYLGGMSGLGGGNADLTQRPNLSNLVWSPIGNKSWAAMVDANKAQISGPAGVVLTDDAGDFVWTMSSSGVTFSIGGTPVFSINSTGVTINGNLQLGGSLENVSGGTYAGNIATSGNVVAGSGGADSVGLQTHTHKDVSTGSGNSGSPNAGT